MKDNKADTEDRRAVERDVYQHGYEPGNRWTHGEGECATHLLVGEYRTVAEAVKLTRSELPRNPIRRIEGALR